MKGRDLKRVAYECNSCGNVNKCLVKWKQRNPGTYCNSCGTAGDWSIIAEGEDVEFEDEYDELVERENR